MRQVDVHQELAEPSVRGGLPLVRIERPEALEQRGRIVGPDVRHNVGAVLPDAVAQVCAGSPAGSSVFAVNDQIW